MPKSASGNKVTRPDSSGKPHQLTGSDGGDGVQLVFFFCFLLHCSVLNHRFILPSLAGKELRALSNFFQRFFVRKCKAACALCCPLM